MPLDSTLHGFVNLVKIDRLSIDYRRVSWVQILFYVFFMPENIITFNYNYYITYYDSRLLKGNCD